VENSSVWYGFNGIVVRSILVVIIATICLTKPVRGESAATAMCATICIGECSVDDIRELCPLLGCTASGLCGVQPDGECGSNPVLICSTSAAS
jgi:hypothetical protein